MSISINRSGAFAAFMSIVQNSAAGAVFFDELRFVFGENRHGLSQKQTGMSAAGGFCAVY